MLGELPPEIAVLRFGTFALDLRRHELRRDGRPVRLPKLPFEGLRLLAAHPQIVLTRAELIAALWPGQLADRNENLDTLMRQVRLALGDVAQNPRFLQTVRGVGFCFLADVTRVTVEAPAPPEPVIIDSPQIDSPQPAAVAPPPPARRRSWAQAGLAAAASALVLAAGVFWLSATRTEAPLQVNNPWVAITHDGRDKDGAIFVRRGWVYFNEVLDSHYRVVRVPTAGGAVEPVAMPWPDAVLVGASPDGATLVVENPVPNNDSMAEAPLWLVGRGGTRPLGDLTGHAAAWSPDGHTILVAGHRALWVSDADGGHARRLLALAGDPVGLAWSPDSARFRFAMSPRPDTLHTEWEARRDGSGLRNLGPLPPARSNLDQAWRPDGRGSLVVEVSGLGNAAWEVPPVGWLPLAKPPAPRRIDLGLLSDSPQVAFDASMRHLYRIGSESGGGDLVRYDAAARQFRVLAPGLSLTYLDDSPLGDAVVYDSIPENVLWRAQADFQRPRALTPPGLTTQLPRWSPDGKWIAFIGQRVGYPWDLEMVPSAGGAIQVLAAGTSSGGMGAPTWSPDGESLYFGRVNCPDPAACGIQRLDLRSRAIATLPGSGGLRTARISPDGRYLAAIRSTHEIVICDLRTGIWRRLAAVGTGDVLNWSRDSRYIYAFEPRGAQANIFRVRLRDGAIEPVASLASLGSTNDMVGDWFGLDRQDRLIVFQLRPGTEIFSTSLEPPSAPKAR